MKKLIEMSIAELTAELNGLTGKNVKKAKGSKEAIIAKIEALRTPAVQDRTVWIEKHVKRNGDDEWRILLSADGKIRWLNMKPSLELAQKAADRAAIRHNAEFSE